MQALEALEPSGEVKFAGQGTESTEAITSLPSTPDNTNDPLQDTSTEPIFTTTPAEIRGRLVRILCTPCRLCRLFKTFKNTEYKSLEFLSREMRDGMRSIKLTGIRKEPVQLGEKKWGFEYLKKVCMHPKKKSKLGVHAPKKSVHKVCMHCKSKFVSNVLINRTSLG
jgi:hypothetical protein